MKQKGFAHIFLILFLVVGLAVAVYLVQKKTNILPKAYESYNEGIGSTAPIGIGSTSPIGIGSTTRIGIGSTVPISAIPSQPFDLKLVNCSADATSARVEWKWEGVSSSPITYYIRYRRNGSWWPDEAAKGATLEKSFQIIAEKDRTLDLDKDKILWGVSACNGEGGCSYFVLAQKDEIFRCPPALPTLPPRP